MGGTPTAVVIVPPGALVVLIGAAGSGKSTLAARLFPSAAVQSSDAFRARIGTGEADQSVTRAAFAALHRVTEARLSAGRTTVIDATNLTSAARSALLRRARKHGRTAHAIVLDLPADVVLARNAARAGRVVPESAVRRQLGLLRAISDESLIREGFTTVRWIRTDDALASLKVEVGG